MSNLIQILRWFPWMWYPYLLISIDLASDSVVRRWDSISKKIKILLDEFLIAFQMVLNTTVFIFNNKMYKQIFGIPLSPVVANMVMQDFEENAIRRLPVWLLFYHWYVDNIILAALSDNIDDILGIFNSLLYTRLQFTMEVGTDKKNKFF